MEYKVKKNDNVIVVRMGTGCDLFTALVDVCSGHGVRSGIIAAGIGQLKDPELGYMKVDRYLKKKFTETMELLSLQGSIAEEQNSRDLSIHAHAVLSDENFEVYGGHLFGATVGATAEVTILHHPGMKREVLPSGLKLLRFE
jgi:predicted DNA-binding protein with PD1-like motif